MRTYFLYLILPPEAKVIIDIYNSNKLDKVNCTSLNKEIIICDTKISNSSTIIKLTEEKSEYSSVEWKLNLQKDYLIFMKSE